MLDLCMKRQLPPLNSLVAAEAAARLGSFRAASEELHVTASAISHQIRALEAWLGFRLFNRSVRSVGLTDAGKRYLFEVSILLDDLAKRTKTEIARSGKGQMLTLQTTDSFANRWLVSRLPDFLARHPAVSVQIITFEFTEGFHPSEADIAVLYGRGDWPNIRSQLLLPEKIFPVASPKHSALGRDKSWTDSIGAVPLLHDDNLGMSWREWWTRAGNGRSLRRGVDLSEGQHFNHSHMSLLAAELGGGIALASWPLVIDALKEKSLLALFSEPLETGLGYHVLESADAATRARTRQLFEWLMARAAADLQEL